MSRYPQVKWAQRSDTIHITIDLPDAKEVKVELQPDGRFIFSATKDSVQYAVNIELFDKIIVEESKSKVVARSIECVIKKAEKKWWDRLIKQEGKPPGFLKIDWDKWVEEEDENECAGKGFVDADITEKPEKNKIKKKRKVIHRWLRNLRLDCLGKLRE